MKILITERQLKYIVNILNEDFKSQKTKYLEQGYDEGIIDTYLKDFKEIKNREYSEFLNSDLPGLNIPKGNDRKNIDNYKTFKEVELIVDYMAGQRKVGSANFEDIQVDGKPIYGDEDVEIYYAPNKESCVRYKGDKPYSWCIARSDSSNMFMRYRVGYERPSFYFVKRKDATDKEFEYWNTSGDKFQGRFKDKYHFFVIQALKNNNYIVTSAMNDGDIRMTWEEILKFAPELQGKQDYFESKPLSDVEVEKYEKYKKGLTDEQFFKLPYVEKEYYINTAVDLRNPLTDRQFSSLPEDLKNKYINLGIDLTKNQMEEISKNKRLLKRLTDVANEKFEMEYNEQEMTFGDVSEINYFRQILYYRLEPSTYILLNDENKKLADEDIKREINQRIDNWIIELGYFHYYFDFVETLLHQSKNELPISFTPNIYYFKTLIPKEKILENKDLLKFLFFIYLISSKENMKEYVNYLGISENDIVSSFKTKEEKNLYKKLNK